MKILLAGEEICGYLKTYQVAFRKLGHEADTAIHKADIRFPDYKYDYYLNQYNFDIKPSIFGKEIGFLKKLFHRIKQYRIKNHFVQKEAVKYDLIIFLWRSLLNDYSDFPYLKQHGCKIITFFVGSDVRYNSFFLRKYDMTGLNIEFIKNHPLTLNKIENRLKYVRSVEKYSDMIFSAPDQDGLQVKPYYHMKVPMNIDKYPFKNNRRKVPVVTHAPSNPWKKGTDVIERTLEQLKNEGVEFEYVRLQNIPNNKVVEFLMEADLLIDELVFHGPATLSFEAMLCGCAVATRHLSEYRNIFGPPIMEITTENVYEKVKELILNYELRQDYIVKGRTYVEQKNNVDILAAELIDKLNNPTDPDYKPELNLEFFNENEQKILMDISKTIN